MRNFTSLILGSMTHSLKARKILMRQGIRTNVIKIDENIARNGCTHGIEIESKDFYTAIDILRRESIQYTIYESR